MKNFLKSSKSLNAPATRRRWRREGPAAGRKEWGGKICLLPHPVRAHARLADSLHCQQTDACRVNIAVRVEFFAARHK